MVLNYCHRFKEGVRRKFISTKKNKCRSLAQSQPTFASKTEVKLLKTEVIMWFAVIVSVCLATEVLNYLTGGEIRFERKSEVQK
jgi:hypothetical protein